MKYSDIVEINENFQYSINLQFDINNINKIKQYIPTSDSCEVLEYYIDSILGNASKSTTLVGPYGKGKSHLLLVLLTLLNDYNKEDEKVINELLLKIKKINEQLYLKLFQIRKEKMKYMPIIINSNYNNMNQAFLLAVSEALEREKIDDIVINTYFDIALNLIEKWEKEGYKEVIKKLTKYLENKGTSLIKLKNKLKMYDESAYDLFKIIYSQIMHGMEFNPLINADIIKYYKDINYRITEYGYNGMLIIFDEFSKFLEYVGNESMMKDLKIIQDFAELAARTGKKEQIIFSCITHKTINEYIKNLKENKVNAFRTVEGRFKEIKFNRSMEQNYEIVAQTIIKKSKFKDYIKNQIENKKEFYKKIEEEFPFVQIERSHELIYQGCYPLNPVTVYALIHLSENIAQNERTLFTFLTDDDTCGFKHFISNKESTDLFNIDKIYDYFYNILKKEKDDYIKEIWIKTESAINKTNDEEEQKIIKAISIIYMINNFEELLPKDNALALALDMDEELFAEKISNLIEKGIIKKRKTNKAYDFSTVYNREVLKELDRIINARFSKIDEKVTLNKIVDLGYMIPRRYNQKYKMTRFFKMLFISEEELNRINSFKMLEKENFCDGLVLNLIKKNYNTYHLNTKIEQINDEKVILRIPEETFSDELFQTLREYEAIQYMKNTEKNDEEIERELNLIEEEDIELIQNEIDKKLDYSGIKEIYYLNNTERSEKLSSLISDICETVYPNTPVINNEMINKNEITTPIKKSREIIINSILNKDKSLIKNNTSAEATIYKAIVDKKNHTDIRYILNEIKSFISNSEDKGKTNLENLCLKMQEKPFGIRKGILPILFAISIEEYGENIVLYYQDREIEINGENISKIVEEPQKYYIYVEKGTSNKIEFVSNLFKVFKIEETDNYRNNIKILTSEMKRWVLSLPKITREISNINFIIPNKSYIEIKNDLLQPDMNNNEFLFQKIEKSFETNNYDNLAKKVGIFKKVYDSYLDEFTNKLIYDFREKFVHNSKSNLNIILNNWNNTIEPKVKKTVVKLEIKKLLDYTENINTYNDKEIIENVSNIVVGRYIEDWQENTYNEFFKNLDNILKEIEKLENSDFGEQEKIKISYGKGEIQKYIDTSEISLLGNTLKNNIEDSIEEYGQSVSESEKIKILLQIIKKYM